jgi:hypothetical protein
MIAAVVGLIAAVTIDTLDTSIVDVPTASWPSPHSSP